MAGSERLQDAHGKTIGYNQLADNMGWATRRGWRQKEFSDNALAVHPRRRQAEVPDRDVVPRVQDIDLVFLLQSSLAGSARTILYVCLHQSAECDSQSFNACDFGLHFATVRVKPTRRATRSIAKLGQRLEAEQREAEAALARGGVGRDPRSYADVKDIRQAQVRDAKQRLKWLAALTGRAGSDVT